MKIKIIIVTILGLIILSISLLFISNSNPQSVSKKEVIDCKGRSYAIEKTLNGLTNFYNEKRESQNILVSEDKFGFQLIIKKENLNSDILDIFNCVKEKYTITIIEGTGFEANNPNTKYCYFANPFNQNFNPNCNF